MTIYSSELLKESKEYFERLSGREVSIEETEIWLDSLADFYLWFSENTE